MKGFRYRSAHHIQIFIHSFTTLTVRIASEDGILMCTLQHAGKGLHLDLLLPCLSVADPASS